MRQSVTVGIVLLGVANISERAGTWDADYYLYESWAPTPGFTPQTEVVNESNRIDEQFDDTELRDGRCVRTRRIRSTLRDAFKLKLFPFDRQVLHLQLSDAQYDLRQVQYDDHPAVLGVEDSVASDLPGWKQDGALSFSKAVQRFRWESGAPDYTLGVFAIDVRRHVTYHLIKFFLPLLVVLVVAFAVFWIDPDDLGSAMSIGVTWA